MQTVPKRVFTHEYRAEAVKLVLAEGLGVTQVARKLGLSVKTYSKSLLSGENYSKINCLGSCGSGVL